MSKYVITMRDSSEVWDVPLQQEWLRFLELNIMTGIL